MELNALYHIQNLNNHLNWLVSFYLIIFELLKLDELIITTIGNKDNYSIDYIHPNLYFVCVFFL